LDPALIPFRDPTMPVERSSNPSSMTAAHLKPFRDLRYRSRSSSRLKGAIKLEHFEVTGGFIF